jgi:thioredoxin-like negative regulator of GroEL
MEFTDENFEKEIQSSEKPVMVDFWAECVGHVVLWDQFWKRWLTIMREKLFLAR